MVKNKQFDPFEGFHCVVPSVNSERQRIVNDEVTGYFVCTRSDCGFGGTLDKAIEHVIKHQVSI
jgi:hypothetical protein